MLGEPPAPEVNFNLPPDQWFNQFLDHFNPTNNVTWKQVSIYLTNISNINLLCDMVICIYK